MAMGHGPIQARCDEGIDAALARLVDGWPRTPKPIQAGRSCHHQGRDALAPWQNLRTGLRMAVLWVVIE